jgi:hypothetical protein
VVSAVRTSQRSTIEQESDGDSHRRTERNGRMSSKRREYTVTKFSMHRDGYLHCRITFEGKPYYVHERSGSWMVDVEEPAGVDGSSAATRTVTKELLSPYKEELAARGRQFRKALAKKKIEQRDRDALAEARVSLDMGYKTKDVEAALMSRFSLTKEEASVILQQAKSPQQPEEASNDEGTTSDRGADPEAAGGSGGAA